jgi:hypothetical protein
MKAKPIIFIFNFFIFCLTTYAQTRHESFLEVIKKVPENISVHLPKSYQVLDTTYGNLNFDKYQDLVIVLKSPKEDTSNNIDNPFKRPLLILFGDTGNKFTLAFKNDNVILCNICGGALGDPFNNITIKNGLFTVEHYGGSGDRWSDYITFKFDKLKKRFYLQREDITIFNVSNPDKAKTTTKTRRNFGIVDFVKFDNLKK